VCVWSFATTTFDLYMAWIATKTTTAQWHLADPTRPVFGSAAAAGRYS